MEKSNSIKKKEFEVQPERTHFQSMLVANPNYFGNIPGSKLKPNFKLIAKTDYEQLTCVGYNPDTRNMEATFAIKKPNGYCGNLCSNGSFEYIRFYLNFHDGAGFIDQGVVAVNVHDIPKENDCKGKSIFPIIYAATLKKKTPMFSDCAHPVLPTLKAILSWSTEPPADSPNWLPPWGNVMNVDIQLKPYLILQKIPYDLMDYLELASEIPHLPSEEISEITGVDISKFKFKPPPLPLPQLIKKSAKLKVPAKRFAFKSVQKMIKYPTSEITMVEKDILKNANVNVPQLIEEFSIFPVDLSKANVNYEELECIALDYNIESLVATIKIKRNAGYSGDLCDDGSKEYISFWIDWGDICSWQYLNTVELKVHDIEMNGDDLCYSVTLPLDATYHKKLCYNPNVVRVRGVLSWNKSPSTTNPDKLEYYGNRVDAHIQIKPGTEINPGVVFPLFNIIGGIDVAHVNDATGLTKPGSFFAYNGLSVPTKAPFGGLIVLNGPSFCPNKYRIKLTNLNTGNSSYVKTSFTCVGYLPYAPYVQYTTQHVDSNDYYTYLHNDENTLNILARFSPGTNDKFLVEIQNSSGFTTFSKVIQMDNTKPMLHLSVDDGGDCTHYTKGDKITGHFYVYDKHLRSWKFSNTWTPLVTGTSNTPAMPGEYFEIDTAADAYPCGRVSLWAEDKTIVNSQSLGYETWASYNICLKEKK